MKHSSANTTPTRKTHEERVETSERLMLDATESLILELGTSKTTLKEVGETAGYSRGLAHARFGSKETLYNRLAARCLATWIQELQAKAGTKTGLQALLSRIDAIAAYAKRFPDDARVMYILWFESVGSPSSMKSELSHFHQQARHDIARLVREAINEGEIAEDVDPDSFSIHFTSAMFGLSYQWVVNPEALDIYTSLEQIRRHMLLVLRPTAKANGNLT